MKKCFLLMATICIPSVVLANDAPKLKVGGRMETMGGFVSTSKDFDRIHPADNTSEKVHNFAIVNDTKVDINADGVIHKYNLKYGGLIRLHVDSSRATNRESSVGDKTMVYLQHDKLGRVEAGNMPGAAALFEMDITFFNKGSWGVDGFWSQWVVDKTKRTNGLFSGALQDKETRGIEFIVSPNLPSNYSGNHYSDASKVSFFTKPIPQITLGVSYIDDLDSTGTVSGRAKRDGSSVDPDNSANPGTFKQIVSGGIVYEGKVSKDLGLKVSLVGEKGRTKLPGLKDLEAMEAGFMFTCKTMKFGGSYGDWFDSYTLVNAPAGSKHNAWYWTAGLGQDIGKFGYSLTYMESRKSGGLEVLSPFASLPAANVADFVDNKFTNFVVDVEYRLAQGFTPYIGVSSYKFKESTGAVDRGQVVMVGSRLLF